ncbi:hypothetical protein [Vibrio parahaemolyticus]
MTAKNPQTTNVVLVIETQAEFDKAQSELTFLEEKHSEVSAEGFDGMRLYAIGYLFWNVLIGERPECIKAQINTLNQLYAQTEIDIRTGIKFLKQMPNSKQGFKIAKDSDITPPQLIKAGFVMCDFKFYPSSFEEVKNHLSKDFIVCDESTSTQAVFGFYHYPF